MKCITELQVVDISKYLSIEILEQKAKAISQNVLTETQMCMSLFLFCLQIHGGGGTLYTLTCITVRTI